MEATRMQRAEDIGPEKGFDPAPFRAGIAEREKKRLAAGAERARRAREFLGQIRDAFLRIDPNIRRIILFGSLARGIPRRGKFDIDIGVRSERYLRLVAWALDQDWTIDVVDLDAIDGTMLDEIESCAESLYER